MGSSTYISIRGRRSRVPSIEIETRTIVVTRGFVRTAVLMDEDYQEGECVPDPERFAHAIRQAPSIRADVFTFAQKLTDPAPRYTYPLEWDAIAAIPITSYAEWWNKHVSTDLRCDVRKAAKRGIEVRQVPFTKELVEGIAGIYNETPLRHGRRFWHYMKPIDAVESENATYLERSEFVGAFFHEELVGFLKIVYVDRAARLMQIIAKQEHHDRRPMNALIAKAVQIAVDRGCSHLTYGKYRYSTVPDSLSAFKKRNGFEEILIPRYYIPITTVGRLAISLKLHHGLRGRMPDWLMSMLKRVRTSVYQRWFVHEALRGHRA